MIRLNSRGDTIIEVLLAISILGFVVVGIFATTSEAQKVGLDSQERSVATRLAEEQIELLKSVNSNKNEANAGIVNDVIDDSAGDVQCLAIQASDEREIVNQSDLDPNFIFATGTIVHHTGGAPECTQGLYTVSIQHVGENNNDRTFMAEVTWVAVGSSENTPPQTVRLVYRLGS